MINPAVSFVRVMSMLLILATHYLAWKNVNDFQLATVGVASFLFISGYLYGNKNIENRKSFLSQRIKRVLVPFWLLSIFLSLFLLLERNYLFAFQNFFETLFCLQGLHSILRIPFKLGTYHISGLSHCWFLTVIMVCYLLVSIIKNTKLERYIDNHVIQSLMIVFVIHFFLSFVNISVGTIVIFFVGYFFKRVELKYNPFQWRIVFFLIFLSISFLMMRIILKNLIDDSPVYNLFVASFTSNFCSVCFFVFVCWVCKLKTNVATLISHSAIWKNVDKISYPVYLTHYIFLKEPFEMTIIQHPLLQIFLFVLLSVVSAIFLNNIANFMTKRIL